MNWNLIDKQQEFLRLLEKQGKSFNTVKNYKADLQCFNGFLIDRQKHLKLKTFTTTQVQEYSHYLDEKYGSSNSVRRRVQALRLFFDFLLGQNIFPENPLKKMPVSPKVLDNPEPTPFHEVLAAHALLKERVSQAEGLAQLVHQRNLMVFHLIYGAGLKVSDLAKLQLASILRDSAGSYRVLVEHPKRDPYSIPLPEIFAADFQSYRARYKEFQQQENLEIDELLFNANPYRILAGGLSPRGIELFFEELRRTLRTDITAKSLRQACIFKWLNLSVPPHATIKEWLGVTPAYSLELYLDGLQKDPTGKVFKDLESMTSTEELIRRTFELARRGLGGTWPNPLVGAVVVKDGRIIGEGFHRRYGGDHAEVDALKNCAESPRGSTIYVNLEPCCHTSKQTPPCAQRLIAEGIRRVVIANLDPNPAVNGGGVRLLREAGIEVEHGVLAAEGEALNEVFFHAQRTKTPFVHLKLAATLDGRVALPSGESQWITGPEARALVHEQRAAAQAVLVGAGTLRKDDPQLTVRLPGYHGPQPHRVVFTETGELPPKARLFTDGNGQRTIVYTKKKLDLPGIEVVQVATAREALQDLHHRKLISLYLEGGPTLAATFLRENLVQRVSLFLNPSFLGAGPGALGDFGLGKLGERPRLGHLETRFVGEDLFLTGLIEKGS